MNKPKSPTFIKAIAQNKRAFHDYFIEERYEAGLVLKGWEVKSLRANRVHITEGYVLIKGGELWILGMHITPLNTVSTHITPDPTRTRKLLLHKREMNKLYGSIERKGYTLVPLTIYWKGRNVKLEIGLGKGKKEHDKRETIKEREWDRQKARVLRQRI